MRRRAIAILACALGIGALATPAAAVETQAAAGPVEARVSILPESPVIGDPITLEIEAIAEPEVELLMPEFGEALDRFSITNFVPRESLDDQGRTVLTQVYSLQVPRSGEHTLPSILIEFVDRRPGHDPAPEGADAYELLTEPLVFEVGSVVVDAADADLAPPLGALQALGRGWTDAWVWIGAIAVGLLATLPFALRWLARSRARALRRSAYDVAHTELERLLYGPRPTLDQMDRFFVELSGIIRRYLENRFELRSPELTTEEFMAQLSASPDLTRPHQDLLRSFLEQADLVKFAHHVPADSDIEEALASASRFLDETRENAPILSGPEPVPVQG